MRIIVLGVASVALSGCSWLGLGGTKAQYGHYNYGNYTPAQTCCDAGGPLSRWNLEAAIGPEYIVGGDAITGDQTNAVPGLRPNSVSMADAYGSGMRYELGGSYALSPNRKVTLMGSYANASGEQVNAGTLNGAALTGTMSDYNRLGVEAGLRQYFMPRRAPLVKALRPYVEGKLGVAKVDDIAIENATLGGAVFNGGTVNMYEGGWVPTAAGMIGLEAPVFKRATLGLETGLRYTGSPKSDNTHLTPGSAFAGINNGGSSLTVPVMLRGRYRF